MKNLFLLFIAGTAFTACTAQQEKVQLSAKAFHDSIEADPGIIVLDVRTPGEYSKGFLNRAVNMDYDGEDFEERIAKLDKNTKYYVYCLAGGRSSSAIKEMQKLGLNVTELKGGMIAWKKEELPVVEMESVRDKISREDYGKLISGGVVLVDFYAPWCGPCRKMEPYINDLQKKYDGRVQIVRINIDENKNLAGELGVMEIPVLKIFTSGKEKWDHRGLASKAEIENALLAELKK